jgi:hypothetical protein
MMKMMMIMTIVQYRLSQVIRLPVYVWKVRDSIPDRGTEFSEGFDGFPQFL